MLEFKVQLADSVPIEKVKVPCIGQLKYNGTRCLAICEDGKVTFKTRNNKEFTYPKLAVSLGSIANCVLDGELCFGDSKDTDHTKVSGIVNSSIHGNPIGSAHQLSYNIFDALKLREFHNHVCTTPYQQRYNTIAGMFCNTGPFIKVAKTWEFETTKQIQDTYEELLQQGYEGLILKYWHDMYEYKRSKKWIKVKAIKTADLICVGYFEGLGKYTGLLGGLVCKGKVDGKDIVVRVGSGLTDVQRCKHFSTYVGHTIEVKYNTVIQNKETGEWSLFLPRFVSVRIDK